MRSAAVVISEVRSVVIFLKIQLWVLKMLYARTAEVFITNNVLDAFDLKFVCIKISHLCFCSNNHDFCYQITDQK